MFFSPIPQALRDHPDTYPIRLQRAQSDVAEARERLARCNPHRGEVAKLRRNLREAELSLRRLEGERP